MRIPVIQGRIDRRILANYRVDPEAMARQLPAPFRPANVGGWAIGGICLIRLKGIRPAKLPVPFGLDSENAAHRIAVEWDEGGRTRTGVYVHRRDTDSRLNALAGGRVFPGIHERAEFEVVERHPHYSVAMRARDGVASVRVVGRVAEAISHDSVFGSVERASAFFEAGTAGYSPTRREGRFDGLELKCEGWKVEPLAIEEVRSSFFEDEERFPAGSAEFDCALLMRGIEHEWRGLERICCAVESERQTARLAGRSE
jgi:hypothetical protein